MSQQIILEFIKRILKSTKKENRKTLLKILLFKIRMPNGLKPLFHRKLVIGQFRRTIGTLNPC